MWIAASKRAPLLKVKWDSGGAAIYSFHFWIENGKRKRKATFFHSLGHFARRVEDQVEAYFVMKVKKIKKWKKISFVLNEHCSFVMVTNTRLHRWEHHCSAR